MRSCFSACGRRGGILNKFKKTLKYATSSPSLVLHHQGFNEAVKLLSTTTTTTKLRKHDDDDDILNSIKFISQSEGKSEERPSRSKRAKITLDNSNVNLVGNEYMKAEKMKEICNKDAGLESNENHQNLSINDKKVSSNLDDNSGIVESCCDLVQPESSDSLFSLSIDSRKHNYGVEVGEKEEVSSLLREDIPIVSNEIVVVDKVEKKSSKIELNYDEDKENVEKSVTIPFSEESPILKQRSVLGKSRHTTVKSVDNNHDVAVDTSFSSWLVVESEKSQNSGNKKDEDRQVLGEISSKVLKNQFNESSSTQSSPSCIAGVGTVGSYLRHTDKARARLHPAKE